VRTEARSTLPTTGAAQSSSTNVNFLLTRYCSTLLSLTVTDLSLIQALLMFFSALPVRLMTVLSRNSAGPDSGQFYRAHASTDSRRATTDLAIIVE
jgi:hypothetical protein